MSVIIPLIKRDWLEFRKHVLSILFFWILMPILIHVFLAIPLSRLITLDVRYLNWSSAGVWITTSCMAAFLVTSIHLRKIRLGSQQIEAILQSPVTNMELLSVIILKGVIFGFCQFVCAIFITSTLNHEYFSIGQIAIIMSQMLVVIFSFSAFGTLIGLIISNGMAFIQFSFTIFLFTSVGMGIFIPMSYYPDGYISIMGRIPFTIVFGNIQAAIINDSIHWPGLFLTIGITGIIIIIALILSHKIFRST